MPQPTDLPSRASERAPVPGDAPTFDRRRFLGSAMAALAAAAVPRALEAGGASGAGEPTGSRAGAGANGASGPTMSAAAAGAAGAPARLGRVGLQLWPVRQDMAQDFEGTLARVAKIGYREVEFENYFGRSAEEVRRIVVAHGLTAPASHITYERLRDEPEKVMAEAKTAGHEYVVFRYLDERERTPEGYARVIDTLNRAGAVAHASGLVLAYHNSTYELTALPDGSRPYDLLLERTDPALVRFEMDVCWLVKGGLKPQDYFRRWPGRFPLLHVKDMDAAGNETELGSGVVDWRALLGARRQAGVTHVFVEREEPTDPWASLAHGYRYLSRLSFRDARA